ncbi:MAG TPA: nucleotide exchange factor GrpE [Micromonosporaceae bacterium]
MTEKPRAAGAASAGPAAGAAGSGGKPPGDPTAERVVIRDKRKIDQPGHEARPAHDGAGDRGGSESTSAAEVPEPETAAADAAVVQAAAEGASEKPDDPVAAPTDETDAEATDAEVPVAEVPVAEPTDAAPAAGAVGLGAELEALRAELEERTRDLQRLSAEYANYRKRVDRDRGLAAERTIGHVLGALLPVLDDLDRAREHGDLVGPFGAVAEQLAGTLAKFGLTAFGEKGDPFDPTRHEAVAHLKSAEVTEPSCIEVMRRGYLLGDRMLRPALVAVADPEE